MGLFGKGKNIRESEDAIKQAGVLGGQINNFQYGTAAALGINNLNAGATNPFADATNTAAGLTNTYGDLRVNTQQAEQQTEANAQNQANILDALVQGGGANAGASATALAAQATQSQAQISADIGRQEAANQQLAAQGEAQRQQAFAQGESQRQQLLGQGSQFQQSLVAQGAQYAQELAQTREVARLEGLYQQQGTEYARSGAALDRRASTINSVIGAVGSIAGAAVSPGSKLFGG